MSNNKFKVGDKVRIIKVKEQHDKYDKYIGKIDVIKTVLSGKADGYIYELGDDIDGFWSDEELELVEKTWDNLEVGDILHNQSGRSYAKILGICGDILFITSWNFNLESLKLDNEYAITNNINHLKSLGIVEIYKPQQEELTELTLEEIAKKFGKDVSQIRIKE